MSRTQASDFLKTLGIEEPTEEQITNYLNAVNGAIKTEKDRADKLKADAAMVDDLKAQIEAMNNQNLTDVEKANKETEKANIQIAELEKQIKQMQTKTKLAELGITGETADSFFNEDGSLNFDILGQIISEREKNASSLKEKELLKKTPNPEGGNNPSGDEKTEAEKVAINIGKMMADSNKESADILSQYTS